MKCPAKRARAYTCSTRYKDGELIAALIENTAATLRAVF
jgi:hypothetical protein